MILSKNTLDKLFPNALILMLFFLFNSLSRLVLITYSLYEKQIEFNFGELTQTLILGVMNDIVTSFYILIPLSVLNIIRKSITKKPKFTIIFNRLFYFILVTSLCFLVISEFTFWLEFSTKFNFIAVDYLVYTHEVIGNIRESYPIFIIFPALFAFSYLIYSKTIYFIELKSAQTFSWKAQLRFFILIICLATSSFFYYNPKITDIKDNNYLSEISKNGLYNLFSAFRHNSIDYNAFYLTRDSSLAINDLFSYIRENNPIVNPTQLERHIQANGPLKDYNVILIPMESLSREFLTHIHDGKLITPVLNDLIKQSIYFDNFYATGTRTIRGLEAITLSVPPIPGQSIVRRENNGNLFSIATILQKENYDIKFIYGGYGYFDNMNRFFAKNGFKTFDRNDFAQEEITFANIWGVSDEDLFQQVIKQADESYRNNQKFFSLVMNVSNHRPYTYLEGKIDIAPKSGRHGGVKYADFALGEFIKIAKTKPWFDNTIFVITADHCAGSAGKVALPPKQYQIPLIIYAPKILKPRVISKMASQIDIAPTILGLLNISYNSRFFGNDIFSKTYNNAFISTFQKLGYIENDTLIVLSPGKVEKTYKLLNDYSLVEASSNEMLMERAINYYQSAYTLFQDGTLKTYAKEN
ncbi:MAG: LTA synthase family protein [Rickettsiales bacterium]